MIFPLRVYYEDTDFSGFVYHARYLHFFERARTEMLRAVGIDQRTLFEAEDGPFGFVVRRMTIDYRLPARMDDELAVETTIEDTGAASLVMRQVLRREETLLCEAEVTIAFLCAGRPRKIPADLKRRLATLTKG